MDDEWGRPVSTARELAGHLFDMGQLDLGMVVLEMQMQVEGVSYDDNE
jgi:hypothetical protein